MSIQEFYCELIEQYLNNEKNNPHSQVGQLKHYNNLNLEQAIDDAVFGRYIVNGLQYFSYHYKYFPQEEGAQIKARENLLINIPRLNTAKDFMVLYGIVREITEHIKGLSLLFYYDVALRIAASKDISLSPEHVFLQRGSWAGAKATGLITEQDNHKKYYADKYIFNGLSKDFKILDAQDIETFLCVYHKQIEKFMKSI